jgi:LasA protease
MFGNGIVRLVAVGALAASLVTPTAETPPQHAAHAPDLEVAVQQSFADAPGGSSGEPIVEPRDYTAGDTWAFGSGTTLEKDDPSMTLFVAQKVHGDWKVALEGSEAFASLAQKAPDEVIPRSEGEVLAETRPGAAGSSVNILDPGLSLPWPKGESWRLGAGLHTNTGGGDDARNSVDFSGEGSVLAPRDGVLYKSCRSATSALVKIVHDNGYSTTYYHMVDVTQVPDGTPITAGTPLGRIGNELPCGGHSTGAHVHFSLLKGNEPVSLDGVEMGGWVLRAGAENYQGWAERDGSRVGTGGRLENHGANEPVTPPAPETPPTPENPPTTDKPALSTGTVRAPNGNSVSLREAPRLDAPVVRTVQIGETVQITCTARGDELIGYWGLSTDLWNQLPTGEWISDGFLDTGTTEPVAPACG